MRRSTALVALFATLASVSGCSMSRSSSRALMIAGGVTVGLGGVMAELPEGSSTSTGPDGTTTTYDAGGKVAGVLLIVCGVVMVLSGAASTEPSAPATAPTAKLAARPGPMTPSAAR